MRLRVSGDIQRKAVIICICLAGVFVLLGFYVGFVGYQALQRVGGMGSAINQAQNHLSDLGNFGSFFQGPVASIWALAGVLLIFAAFIIQENQLNLQREALAEQRAQFKKQDEAATKQNFESTFFQLLNLQNQIASEMKITLFVITGSGGATSDISRIIEGRDCFETWFNYLKDRLARKMSGPYLEAFINDTPPESVKLNVSDVFKLAQQAYEDFYKAHLANLAQYFNNFYHLIEFVERSEMKDKQWYVNLAAAQLSSYELALLFYHGLSPSGDKLRPFIQGFGLLRNLDKSLIRQEHVDFYGALFPL